MRQKPVLSKFIITIVTYTWDTKDFYVDIYTTESSESTANMVAYTVTIGLHLPGISLVNNKTHTWEVNHGGLFKLQF